MSLESEFDPYHKWLGIPPQHQPPDSYRLLGLEVFESDRDVIRAAAERQTAHIHKYKIGPQSEFSQRLLNEIARARVCLLDPASKAEYDRALRLTANQHHSPDIAAPPVAPPPVATPPPPVPADAQVPANVLPLPNASNDSEAIIPTFGSVDFAVRRRKPNRRKQRPAWGLAFAICAAAAVLSAIAIKKLVDITEAAAPTSPGVAPVPTTEPAPTTRPKRNPPKKKPTRRGAKLPIPANEALNSARDHIEIDGIVTCQELLQAAEAQEAPAMRYILYQMTIQAAVKEQNREIASIAIEQLTERYEIDEVDAAALRKKLREIPEAEVPAPVGPAAEVPEAFTIVKLPSGKAISADDLKPPPLKEIREDFPANVADETTVFVLRRDTNQPPEGLFAFSNKKEFEGRALVLYPDGRPKVLLTFANHVRNGVLRHWNSEGEILLFAEFKKGNNLGLTCLCEGGKPILVEEWDTSQKPKSYLIDHTGEAPSATDFEHANAEQQQQMLDASDALNTLRAELLKEEHGWKQSFKRWWDKNDSKLRRLQLPLKTAPEGSAKKKLEKELSELIEGIEAERRAGVAAVFDNLKLN